MESKTWKEVYAVPTDGQVHQLSSGIGVIHFPATKIKHESVLVSIGEQYLRRRKIRGVWHHAEPTIAAVEFGHKEIADKVNLDSDESMNQILKDFDDQLKTRN